MEPESAFQPRTRAAHEESAHGLHRRQRRVASPCPTAGRCSTRSRSGSARASTSALIGANGAGKSTLLRDHPRRAASRTPASCQHRRRPRRHGPVRRAPARRLDRARPAGLGRAAAPCAPPRSPSTRAENALIDARHDAEPDGATPRRSPTTRMPAATSRRPSGTTCTIAALGIPFERAKYREVTSSRGGEQKRLALEALLRGPEQVLLLDEPDNYLDVPASAGSRSELRATQKTVLLVSHDRELLARAADRIITVELGGAGNTTWTHGGGFGDLPRGARRPDGPPRRAASGAGTSSTRSSSTLVADPQGQGDGERRLRVALPGRA